MADFVADNIVKEFPTPAGPLEILKGACLTLERGENASIVGPSGCGKSTFLQIAGTLDVPTSGSLTLLAQSPDTLNQNQLAEFRNRNIGFVFQDHHLLPQLSALENALLPMVAQGSVSDATVQRGKSLLEKVGLSGRVGHLPAQLSGGERQRVAVARALINEPVLVLADEPTGSLDPKSAEGIGQLLIDLQQEQNAILVCVTHSRDLAATFQKKMRLEGGKLVES